ncbi:MAG: rhodanese-like domain-containing protein [Epsilonproteobacteria bacterium]|nr:MAG: rhodanese-like domain-containing protein [Campylobacterota bacterium]
MKLVYLAALALSTFLASANVVEIVEGMPHVKIEANGKIYKIERTQEAGSYLTNTFALTSRPSPPFFIEPFTVSPGVETYGELEVLDFISKKKGIFIDARLANWYARSAIPSAVNIPFKIFLTDTPLREKTLKDLGVGYTKDGQLDFSTAQTILLYCNGAWCGQSPTAINALIDLGYPKSKMKYYRGGMQAWQLLGLTTFVPDPIPKETK